MIAVDCATGNRTTTLYVEPFIMCGLLESWLVIFSLCSTGNVSPFASSIQNQDKYNLITLKPTFPLQITPNFRPTK